LQSTSTSPRSLALSAYHVFLTAYRDFDLHVSERGSEGFRVQAKNATASGRFVWRVVAKRKDTAAPRFETVEVLPEPVLPNIPEPPAAPEPPLFESVCIREDRRRCSSTNIRQEIHVARVSQ